MMVNATLLDGYDGCCLLLNLDEDQHLSQQVVLEAQSLKQHSMLLMEQWCKPELRTCNCKRYQTCGVTSFHNQIKWDEARWSEIYIDTIGYYQHQQTAPKWGINHQIRPAAAAFLRASRPACRIWVHTNQNEKIWNKYGTIWHQYEIIIYI